MSERGRITINPFWLMTALFLTAALFFALVKGLEVLPGVTGPSNLKWIRVHLITIGTVLQMVFATLPGFVARKWGFADRSPREAWLQWALLNSGYLLVIFGLVGMENWTATLGAALVFTAVWRLLAGMVTAWRQAGGAWRESLRFFAAAPIYLLVGIIMAVSLLFNWWAPGGRPGVYEAHVHANVWGFAAQLVAGFMLDLFPAVTGAKQLARPQWTGRVFWLLNTGAMALVAGPWLGLHFITVPGLLLYMAGTAALVANLILTLRAHAPISPDGAQLVLAYLWMVVPAFFAPFIVLAPHLVRASAIEAVATQGLINGWLLGIVLVALPRVLAGRQDFGADGTHPGGGWFSVIALNLGVGLVWSTGVIYHPLANQVLVLTGYSLIGLAWIPLLRQVWSSIAIS
ncbi:MAG TPA: hypothetical protein VD902_22050 [Symbiobacteriaceae bacterium]|nr:hypothetical protein [Symbiobacteriaceae bacterium]